MSANLKVALPEMACLSDFLPAPSFDSESSSPDISSLPSGADISLPTLKTTGLRLGSRPGSMKGLQTTSSACLEPLSGGPSPTLGLAAGLDPWLEDSCSDVCEQRLTEQQEPSSPQESQQLAEPSLPVSSPGQQHPASGEADNGTSPTAAHAAAPSPCEPPLQCTPTASSQQEQQRECSTPSTAGGSVCTPPERPFTSVTDAPSSTPSTAGRRDARLLHQVNLVKSKLASEAEARRTLQVQLAEQRLEKERMQQQLERSYEARLHELRQQLNEAAAGQSTVGRSLAARISSGAHEVRLSGNELESLRREMVDQEMLLRAYQAENELAVSRIKDMQAQHRQDMEAARAESERLRKQLAAQQDNAQQLAAASPGPDTASRLQEILSLQSKLESVQAAAYTREQDLKQALQATREEKRELQARLEQLEVHSTQAQAQIVQQVEAQVAALRQEHARHTADMQARLQWYAENHALLKGSEDLVAQQASMIIQLEQQLLSPAHRSGSSIGGSGNRLADLKRENERLMAEVAQAVAVPGEASGRETALAEMLQQKLAQLEGAMVQRGAEHERRVNSLRQEADKLRSDLAKRVSAHKGTSARLKELEQQMEEIRSTARKKVQALELKLKAAQAKAAHAQAAPVPGAFRPSNRQSKPPAPAAPAPSAASGQAAAAAVGKVDSGIPPQQREQQQRIHKLEAELARREAELASLQKRAAAADDLVNQAAEREQEMMATMRSLQQSLGEVTSANGTLRAQLGEAQALKEQLATSSATQARVQELQRQLDTAEKAMATLRQAHAEAQEQAASIKAEHLSELRAAREQHSAQQAQSQQLSQQLAAASRQVEDLQSRVRQLECSLSDARAGIPWTPKAVEFAALERKLSALEAQQAQREAHWRGLIDEATLKLSAQGEALRQRYELAMASKDAQLEGFRRQVDGVLAAARLAQQAQQAHSLAAQQAQLAYLQGQVQAQQALPHAQHLQQGQRGQQSQAVVVQPPQQLPYWI